MLRDWLTAAALAVAAVPAFADEPPCFEPYAPARVDPKTVTLPQMCRYREDVIAFLMLSDTYQECMLGWGADPANKADDAQKSRIVRQVDGNQREKERVGEEFNAASGAYNLAKGACDGVDTRAP